MRIRPAVVEDAAALARVYVDSWRDAYAGLLPDMVLVGMSDVRQAAAWARELQHESAGATLVAEDESGVFGLSTVGPARAASKAFLEGGEIYRLYVEPGRQNEGAGRALMEASFAWMARCGDDAAIVWVLDGNPARFFYEALGGVRLGERPERFCGADIREIAYGWRDLRAAVR